MALENGQRGRKSGSISPPKNRFQGANLSSLGLLLLGIWMILRMTIVVNVFQAPGRVQLVPRNTYLELANSLLDRGTYEGYSYEDMDLVRTPGYPVFLAGILKTFNRNLAFVALAQLLLTVGICGLIYLAALTIAGRGVALAAAWLYALNFNSLYFALVGLTETLFTALLTLSIFLLVRYRERASWGWLAGSGLALGATALVRPIVVWLIPIWAIFVLLAHRDRPWRDRLYRAVAVGLFTWIVFLPWQARNYAVHRQFTLSTVGESTIRNWMIAEGLAEAKGITREQAVAEIDQADNPTIYSLQLIGRYPGPMAIATLRGIYRTSLGFEYASWMNMINVQRQPGRTFVNAALGRNIPLAWRAGVQMLQEGHIIQFGVTVWALLYDLSLFVLTLVGAFVLGRRHQCWWCVALLMIVAGYLIISPAGAGQARFRVPAAPSLAFLSGAGLAGLLSSLSRRA